MSKSESKVCDMCSATVTLLIAVVILDTTIGELTPAELASGMAKIILLSKRNGAPGLPEFMRNRFVLVSRSDFITKVKSTGVPHAKRGEVLTLKGIKLAALLPLRILG